MVSIRSLASAAAHASISGNIHLVAEDDKHAMELTTKLLSFLPSNNISDPPHKFPDLDLSDDLKLYEIVPAI